MDHLQKKISRSSASTCGGNQEVHEQRYNSGIFAVDFNINCNRIGKAVSVNKRTILEGSLSNPRRNSCKLTSGSLHSQPARRHRQSRPPCHSPAALLRHYRRVRRLGPLPRRGGRPGGLDPGCHVPLVLRNASPRIALDDQYHCGRNSMGVARSHGTRTLGDSNVRSDRQR